MVVPTKRQAASSKQPYEYKLAVKDFIPVSEFIAAIDTPKPISIPPTFMTTLNRVIRVRNSFSALLEKEVRFNEDSYSKHLHFVGVLEKVRDILKPLVDATDLSEMQETVSDISTNHSFGLKFYELPEDTLEDAYFAFYALFQDALSLRSRINELWNGYKSSTIHLTAASVAANTAINLVRQMEEDIAPLINKHGGFLQFIQLHFAAICISQGKDCKKREHPNDDINMDAYEIADHCMFNACQWLDAFRRAHCPGHVQAYNGQFGKYTQSSSSDQLPNRTKYQQDKTALLEVLGEITFVVLALEANLCEDEFTRGIRIMLQAAEVPFWVVFAAQIFLDTLRCLQGPNALRPLEEMQAWNSTVADSLNTVMSFHCKNKLRIKNWPPSNDAILKDIIGICNFWANDPIGAIKQRCGLSFTPFLFLQRHAIFCGLWIQYVRASFHEAGIKFNMAWSATLYAGCLYHAMRREGLLEAARWNDMELLLALQGANVFFTGSPPRDAEHDFKNYCQCMGHSVLDWVPPSQQKRGQRPPVILPANPQSLEMQADVSMRLMQLLGVEKDSGITTEDVNLILAASQWVETREGDWIVMEKGFPVTKPRASGKASRKQEKSLKRREATPAELIVKLALVLQAEVPEVSFDYFAMHITCWSMLENVRNNLDGKLRDLFMPHYPEDVSQLPFVVGNIFMAAARKEARPGKGPLNLMRMAAPPVARVIERQGHSILDKLERIGNVNIVQESDGDDEGEKEQ